MFREAPHPSTELQLRPPVWVWSGHLD
jgi:hypothetical protein